MELLRVAIQDNTTAAAQSASNTQRFPSKPIPTATPVAEPIPTATPVATPVIPTATPVAQPASDFAKTSQVIIAGPLPLPVSIVSGGGGSGALKTPSKSPLDALGAAKQI